MPSTPASIRKSTARFWLPRSRSPCSSKVVGRIGNTPLYIHISSHHGSPRGRAAAIALCRHLYYQLCILPANPIFEPGSSARAPSGGTDLDPLTTGHHGAGRRPLRCAATYTTNSASCRRIPSLSRALALARQAVAQILLQGTTGSEGAQSPYCVDLLR